MNSNYIYDIFETTRKNSAPDLNVGLAMLMEKKPLPEGTEPRALREFLGGHYEELTAAYRTRDREIFARTVENCEAADRLLEEERRKKSQEGNG